MKTIFTYLFLIVLVFILSCDMQEMDHNRVFAGTYSQDFIYHEFSPPFRIKTTFDPATGFYNGSDSLDLDQDRNFDIVFTARLHPADTVYKQNGVTLFPYIRLYFKNGFEVAVKKMNYACGHGYCNWADFVAAFENDVEISEQSYWGAGYRNQTLWVKTDGSYPPGWWTRIDSEEMYIGIRKKEKGLKNKVFYRYGWIQVNALSLKDVQITGYALQ